MLAKIVFIVQFMKCVFAYVSCKKKRCSNGSRIVTWQCSPIKNMATWWWVVLTCSRRIVTSDSNHVESWPCVYLCVLCVTKTYVIEHQYRTIFGGYVRTYAWNTICLSSLATGRIINFNWNIRLVHYMDLKMTSKVHLNCQPYCC